MAAKSALTPRPVLPARPGVLTNDNLAHILALLWQETLRDRGQRSQKRDPSDPMQRHEDNTPIVGNGISARYVSQAVVAAGHRRRLGAFKIRSLWTCGAPRCLS